MVAPAPLTPQQLSAYLARIGFSATPRLDSETLHALVQAHVQSIPFENIDVQLGRTLTTDQDAAFAKLVEARRGGWCYEHNGLLAAALMAIGFEVMRVSGAVMRQVRGEAAMGTHLCLLVACDGTWLVDVGFGSWIASPVPLRQGCWMQAPLPVALSRTDDDLWRLTVTPGETMMSYDFAAEPANEGQLSALCRWQCTDPSSVFVQNLSIQRRHADTLLMLRGKVLSRITPGGETRHELADANDLIACLRRDFGLDLPEAAGLWPAICARHEALFGGQAAPTT
ncbi:MULTISPECIES: arylamine N-acetyltransferase [Novosphingobium]|uniref:arylamine N-acetyltransferase family protein n=1 Tax=Novosphingobium TaxID=165696 RepID=UPI000D6E1DB8|nr:MULTISPECIES: arylamine N-acetyltransferase [Novosphingobium]